MIRHTFTAALLIAGVQISWAQLGAGPHGPHARSRAQQACLALAQAQQTAPATTTVGPGRGLGLGRAVVTNSPYVQPPRRGGVTAPGTGCGRCNCRCACGGRTNSATLRPKLNWPPRARIGQLSSLSVATPADATPACIVLTPASEMPVSAAEIEALRAVLFDEYRAEAYYSAVLEKFGSVRMLENIRAAEVRHVAALRGLFDRYQVEPPTAAEIAPVEVPASLAQAITSAVELERDNAALYDEWLKQVEHDDVHIVFAHLRDASRDRHLPALRRFR